MVTSLKALRVILIIVVLSFIPLNSTPTFASDGESFTPEQRQYVESLRPLITSGLQRLTVKAQSDPAIQEEIDVANLILQKDSDVNLCNTRVLFVLRKNYISAEPVFDNQVGVTAAFNIPMPSHNTADTLPWMLYLFKGSTVGLYEYTKLTGMYASTLDVLWQGKRQWTSDDLLAYRLYAFTQLLNYNNDIYYTQAASGYLDISPGLEKLNIDFGDKPLLRRFLLQFPFEHNSFTMLLAREKRLRSLAEPSQVLADYYTKLIFVPQDRIDFLTNVGQYFGKDVQRSVLLTVIKSASFSKADPAFVQQVFKLSVDAELSDVSAAIITEFPAQHSWPTALSAKQHALETSLDSVAALQKQASLTTGR